jgi:hypothetical protein
MDMKKLILLSLIATAGIAPLAAQEQAAWGFARVSLSDRFFAEGSNIGDLNRDGASDIVAAPYWYEGP